MKELAQRTPAQQRRDQALSSYLASGQSFPTKTPLTIGNTLVCYTYQEYCPEIGEVVDVPFYDALVVDANQEGVLTREEAHTIIRCRIESVTGIEEGWIEGVPVRTHLNILMVPVDRAEHEKYYAMVQHLSFLASARRAKALVDQLPYTHISHEWHVVDA